MGGGGGGGGGGEENFFSNVMISDIPIGISYTASTVSGSSGDFEQDFQINPCCIMFIHQPCYTIFKLFDTLTLLFQGSMVYHGQANMALEYFDRSLGEFLPDGF